MDMSLDKYIQDNILQSLYVNMGFKKNSEKVLVIAQTYSNILGEDQEKRVRESFKCADVMCQVMNRDGAKCDFLTYSPSEPRNGADAPKEIYDDVARYNPDVVFMPTAYSLSHTGFRRMMTEKGIRVASMPTFTLEMFAKDGPCSSDQKEMTRLTKETYQKLKESRLVRVIGPYTDVTIELDPELSHMSDGILTGKGEWGNLPGAESYNVPKHLGHSNGIITIPRGWGGPFGLEHTIHFDIVNGLFHNPRPKQHTADSTRYVEEKIKPLMFGKGKDGFNVLAELGIGTNPAITQRYIESHGFSILLAEKVYGTAHFANGNSKGMGGKNDVPVHIDWVVPNTIIEYIK